MASTIAANGRIYTVVDDIETSYRALIIGAVIDEVVGGPFRHAFTVTVDRPGMAARALDGGLFCLSGYVELVFPDLAATPYAVTLTITADGYRPASLAVAIPAGTAVPVAVPVVPLRPLPVRLQGRVVDDQTRTPLAGAVIQLGAPVTPPFPAAVRTVLHSGHLAGTTVREQPLNPAGAATQLAAASSGGTDTITLNNRTGLAAGTILRLGSPPRVEYGVIASLAATPANPLQPGDVTFTAPLRRGLAIGAPAQAVTPGAPGAAHTLTKDAEAGDGLLFLDGALGGDTVAILDAIPARVEYAAVGALTDSEGFYALDGIGRVRQLTVTAAAAGHTATSVPWTFDYDQPVNIVNFRLSP